ncbi:MAG: DUF1848 domain-containing protein [Nitrospinae bacterium]|nr:DUF1848 domain-containing protein [Nitrospinota bacterium]
MIVSASRRTDISAWYADWLVRRLREGFVRVKAPYGGKERQVSLAPADVAGLVFWSRNPAPAMGALFPLVAAGGRPFYLTATVTGYPSPLEPDVPSPERVIPTLRRFAVEYGPASLVWRYDPILLTDAMTPAWHRENFARLAGALAGAADEVVVSFVDLYRKVAKNLPPALAGLGVTATKPSRDERRELAHTLAASAREAGMRLTLCCEPELVGADLPRSACVDGARLARVAGGAFPRLPRRPTREGCGCHASMDIGAYDTCPAGCPYCYATQSRERAAAFRRGFDEKAEGLFLSPPR